MKKDEKYMMLAIELAKKGIGRVNPNPLVGCVIVRDDDILSTGYHEAYGENHAERNAILSSDKDLKGATLYVNLEPCSHFGKTPPCTDIIIKSGLAKVVIGSLDPNPVMQKSGVEILAAAGIEVIAGVCAKAAFELNEVFFKYITTKIPFVLLKSATTLDGKIATTAGQSKWITSEPSRKKVHELRNQYSGIMVGINTVIEDDPMLNCRLEEGRNPLRIIVDSHLRIPLDCQIVKTAKQIKTVVATTEKSDRLKAEVLVEEGIEMLFCSEKDGRVSLSDLMQKLGQRKIDSVLLEGGAGLNYSALESGIVDKVNFFIAPKIFGGQEAKTAVEGKGIQDIADCFKFKDMKAEKIGEDIMLSAYIMKGGG